MKIRTAVIGGGAAGIVSAIFAARAGAEVTIYEHNDCLGKKLLQTGNGKCNFTNISMDPGCYHTSGDPGFISSVLTRFGHEDTIRFFSELGIYTRNRKGGIYPYPETAASVLDVLKMELRRLNVNTVLQCGRLEPDRQLHVNSQCYDSVIIASGGCAARNTGSDGSGYKMLEALGIRLEKVYPALTPCITAESLKELAGIRCEAGLKLLCDGKIMASSRGELQPYDGGLSGICALDLSGQACRALAAGCRTELEADFFPDFSDDVFRQFVEYRISNFPERNINEIFVGMFNKKLIHFLLNGLDCRRADFMDRLVQSAKHRRFLLSERMCSDFSRAQTVTGGIASDELNDDFSLKKVPGIYAAGEITDADGICGGYNLQWAWSSGYIAGMSAGSGGRA